MFERDYINLENCFATLVLQISMTLEGFSMLVPVSTMQATSPR